MEILLLNTYDWGGAAIAVKRIYRGLQQIGVDSQLLVLRRQGNDQDIHGPEEGLQTAGSVARTFSDSWLAKPFGDENTGSFSVNWLPSRIHNRVAAIDPDIVQLNWVGDNFFTPKSIQKFDCPVVWRLSDMWAFTGGCHYSAGCEKFTDTCGSCPHLERDISHDVTWWTHRRKQKAWEDVNITVVSPCTWLAEQAKQSSLFGDNRIEVIPGGINTDLYKPYNKETARNVFDIPQNSKVILFGAIGPMSDSRKGFQYLQSALQTLANEWDDRDIQIVVFGADQPENPPHLGFETQYVGYLNDKKSLALLYAAADVMIMPSKYEGFGNVVVEAMSCGTPVAAFNATAPTDTVDHKNTGYLAKPYESDDLARGIKWIIDDEQRLASLSKAARERAVDNYDINIVAEKYRDLYEDIL